MEISQTVTGSRQAKSKDARELNRQGLARRDRDGYA